ncbi:DUF7117 family protein [Halorubrum sp. DTA46]|uniref:DUF7117 family protein n=1 Tax=Halorubrum sp. DTA46 TaxID=3402162 RepID=UPI003AADA773
MKVRGERECQACGARWSYYETGSIECPDCGGLRSVGVDDRTAHTDSPVDLDLSGHRDRVGDARGTLPDQGVAGLKSDLREYTRKRGFIRGGELLPLDDTYLAARELLEAVDCYERLRDPTDSDREYLLGLLAGADEGDRPDRSHVPESLREARGMAAVHAAEAYRTDLLAFLDELEASEGDAESAQIDESDGTGVDEHPETQTETEPLEGKDDAVSIASSNTVSVAGDNVAARIGPARDVLERLRDRTKRVDALTGDVSPAEADALTEAANAVGEHVRNGTDAALDRARALLADSTD